MSPDSSHLRFGILGTAHVATKVCNGIHSAKNATPVAIASRDLEKASAWAKEHNVEKAYGSYLELLEDPDIDAVYIPLPPSMHHAWAIQAAEHGKHILCEKPLASSVSHTVEMVNACTEYNVQMMDGVMWVHHLRTQAMKDELESDKLGALRRMTAAFSFCWDEIPRGNIRLKPDLGGGCLGDLGYYCVRAMWWAFQDTPIRVFASARYYQDVEFNLSAMLWYDEQRMGSFDCGFGTVKRQWFEIAGTEGSLVCDDFVLPKSNEETRYWVHDQEQNATTHTIGPCTQETLMVENFCEMIDEGQLNTDVMDDAIITMRICAALSQSAREEKIVELGF